MPDNAASEEIKRKKKRASANKDRGKKKRPREEKRGSLNNLQARLNRPTRL